MHCNSHQRTATHTLILLPGRVSKVIYCNTLQHTATHCNTLQHTATRSLILLPGRLLKAIHCNTLHHAATHCNTLQHTAIHCNTLQHTPWFFFQVDSCRSFRKSLSHVASCSGMVSCDNKFLLQCVAVCCSVLQCVVVCCTVLQCVAGCCSVLQCE